MEDLMDKDKTIAILRNRNLNALREIQRLEMELAAAQSENRKLREITKLKNEYDYLLAMYGNIIND
ncbi:hypothetical protein DW973_19015 [Parabacteroides merdae]|jgi:hypothetical protein|uniref:hypothetical protein n=1 Tax=Parabacteroides merdae TaxID=46503 RepID=UPI000E5D59C0|nr:hypothetical protein [Parabacteroides merdae]RGZ74673.1 hypothetical protein DW973_19015 [Parabacteroides merdae]